MFDYHLAENEVRGELTFLEKAQGICVARSLYEETLGKIITPGIRSAHDGGRITCQHFTHQ
ncbi:hypothetical protein IC611_21560 [Proteus mirabilis]